MTATTTTSSTARASYSNYPLGSYLNRSDKLTEKNVDGFFLHFKNLDVRAKYSASPLNNPAARIIQIVYELLTDLKQRANVGETYEERTDLKLSRYIQPIMDECFNVTIVHICNIFAIQWGSDNPYLLSKPLFKPELSLEQTRETFLDTLVNNRESSDKTFEIEGKLFYCQKLFLSQAHYFNGMLSRWEESDPTKLNAPFTAKNFEVLNRYLVTGKLEVNLSMPMLLSLYQVSDMIGLVALAEHLKKMIGENITIEDIIPFIQSNISDHYLISLIEWQIKTKPEYIEKIDVSKIDISTYLSIRSYIRKTCNREINEAFDKKLDLKLNDDFIVFCRYVIKNKDNELADYLVNFMTKNTELLTQLNNGRKDDFSQHYKHYKSIASKIYLVEDVNQILTRLTT